MTERYDGGFRALLRPSASDYEELLRAGTSLHAELLGDSKRVAAEHDVYALTDDREVDRSIALTSIGATRSTA